jgi:flavin reductase (DIM6/NTAB) family NADH-FMN oxidoreductase RutF
MNADAKKTVLRMIPYGIYVLTANDGQGNIAAATVNWVTQSAFAPPLVVVGVKTDSGAYKVLKTAQTFALNMLGKEQKGVAFTFFKPTTVADGKLSGQPYRKGTNGAPILPRRPARSNARSPPSWSRATITSSSARWSRRICKSRRLAAPTPRSWK